ncbi:Protein DEFECTIVE IN MERISTEM SILENCING 3 [Glycine max]|nr:Protein DEFECTIVE IN MERISTEM SILENCING 3 [Glycine max]
MFQPPTPTGINKHSLHTNPLSIQGASSALVPVDLNEGTVDAKESVQNGEMLQVQSIFRHSQKLEDDLRMLGTKIKQHENNLYHLNSEKNKLDDSILHLQVTIGKSESSSKATIGDMDNPNPTNDEEVNKQILQHEKSAAGILCQLKIRHGAQASHLTLTKDVVGIVATLGKVEDDNLSRLFSEYLGVETMLAIVCKTYEGVKALEMPYAGNYVVNDAQRKLDFLIPRLPNGELPSGFLGFAVNMINLDSSNLFCVTPSGYGLRETLFYNLFSRLQVYKTRAEMIQALPCISEGALSLDGGMVRSCGVFSLGNREDVDVRFPRPERSMRLDNHHIEIERQLKDVKWKKEKIMEELKREQILLDTTRFNYNKKKADYLKFLAQSSSDATQFLEDRRPPLSLLSFFFAGESVDCLIDV